MRARDRAHIRSIRECAHIRSILRHLSPTRTRSPALITPLAHSCASVKLEEVELAKAVAAEEVQVREAEEMRTLSVAKAEASRLAAEEEKERRVEDMQALRAEAENEMTM